MSAQTKEHILIRSAIVAAAVLCALQLEQITGGAANDTTVGFTTLSIALLLQAISWSRTDQEVVSEHHKRKFNWPMTINIGISSILLLVAIYVPALQLLLDTRPLKLTEILLIVAVALVSTSATALVLRPSLLTNKLKRTTDRCEDKSVITTREQGDEMKI